MLSVQNLEYYYGRIHALRGVSFEIKEGDLCVIIGSNGAGKSTLMSSLIGMLDATGDIYLNGEKLGREKPYARINRGMVLVPEGNISKPYRDGKPYDGWLYGKKPRRRDPACI